MARIIIIVIKPNVIIEIVAGIVLVEAPELVNVRAVRHFLLFVSEVVVETKTPLRFAASHINHLFIFFFASILNVLNKTSDNKCHKKNKTPFNL